MGSDTKPARCAPRGCNQAAGALIAWRVGAFRSSPRKASLQPPVDQSRIQSAAVRVQAERLGHRAWTHKDREVPDWNSPASASRTGQLLTDRGGLVTQGDAKPAFSKSPPNVAFQEGVYEIGVFASPCVTASISTHEYAARTMQCIHLVRLCCEKWNDHSNASRPDDAGLVQHRRVFWLDEVPRGHADTCPAFSPITKD